MPPTCISLASIPRLFTALLTVILLAGFPASGAADSSEILKISGCSISRAGYLEQLTTAFTARTGIRVLLKGGGSMSGLLTLGAEASDLAASCLPPGAEEIPAGLRLVPVAGDALVFIVKQGHLFNDISLDQVREIFAGRVSNWRQLGGPDLPLVIYLQHSRHGPHGVPYTLQQLLLGDQQITHDPRILVPRPSGGLAEESVARDDHGFSASGFTSARTKKNLKMLAIDGILPDQKNIIAGTYPKQLRRYLYLAVPETPSPPARRFLAFILSAEGQKLLEEIGAIPLAAFPPAEPPAAGSL